MWIASHDDDEQNARLAEHLWEDNGLDVPESFLKDLLSYLGQSVPAIPTYFLTLDPEHENAYVRSSTASAIADAVEHWPQSITLTLNELQDIYREKVSSPKRSMVNLAELPARPNSLLLSLINM